ncbi:MAG: Lrp/AsnC family transcriptional regulator [Acidobacteriaceae bacterium]|nr:Lrp/AsnC family transcriptional regulator [Acidobacteriaceae bacterium]
MIGLDEIDQHILRILQEQGNIANTELADLVGLTPAPCLRRVQRLREDGIIRKFTIEVDNKKLGYQLAAIVEISLEKHTTEAGNSFLAAIRKMPEIQSCHLVTGDFDFNLRVVVRDLEEYQKLVWERMHSVKGIKTIRSTIILNTYKETLNAKI